MRKLRARTGCWILALLILRRGKPIRREWLAATLWPKSATVVAHENLRRGLTDLRGALGSEAARLTTPIPGTLMFDFADVETDVFDFDTAIESDHALEVERAIGYFQNGLLKDCDAPWADQERSTRRARYQAALERLALRAHSDGKPLIALDYLKRLFDLEPLQEEVARQLMETFAVLGDYESALDLYRQLHARLARMLGVVPETQTTIKYHKIRIARRQQAPKPSVPCRARSDKPVGSVPALLQTLIGREQALCEVLAHLDQNRLVTLTGTGGIGKTQLALNVAHETWHDYPDGVWFVDLSNLTEGIEIVACVLRALGFESGVCDTQDHLLRMLESRCLLLVLDNCEHLLPACALFTRRVLERCASVRILATSRQSLNVTGECVWNVPPLVQPPVQLLTRICTAESGSTLESVLSFSAIAFFVTRAIRSRKDFKLTQETLPAVGQICRLLDGVPLAIELAAAWARSLCIKEIAQHVRSGLELLSGGDPNGPTRHQTLTATLDGSYNLLLEEERRLWCELSVFSGGATLEAVQAVCTPSGPGRSLVSLLDRLIDRSVVSYCEVGGTGRYSLLETLRLYGAEKFAPVAAYAAASRHCDYFIQWAEAAAPNLVEKEQDIWLECIDRERGNLHQALCKARDMRACEEGLRLACALWRYWHARGDYSVGQAWLESFLQPGDLATSPLRLKAVGAAGNLAYRRADYISARRLFEGHLHLSYQLGRPRGAASALGNLGNVAADESKLSEARRYYEQSLEAFRELNDVRGIALTLGNLAIVTGREGNYVLACQYYEASIALWRENGDLINLAMALTNCAENRLIAGQYATVLTPLVESLRFCYQLGHLRNAGQCLLVALSLAVREGQYEAAAALVGAVKSLRSRGEMPVSASASARYEEDQATLLDQMDPEKFATACHRGLVLTDEQVTILIENIEIVSTDSR